MDKASFSENVSACCWYWVLCDIQANWTQDGWTFIVAFRLSSFGCWIGFDTASRRRCIRCRCKCNWCVSASCNRLMNRISQRHFGNRVHLEVEFLNARRYRNGNCRSDFHVLSATSSVGTVGTISWSIGSIGSSFFSWFDSLFRLFIVSPTEKSRNDKSWFLTNKLFKMCNHI